MTSISHPFSFLVIIILLCTCTPESTESIVAYKENNKYGFKTISGKVVVPAQFDWVSGSQHGLQKVHKDGKEGMINSAGKFVVPLKYEWLGDFEENGLIEAKLNGKYGFLDTTGREVIPFIYTFTWGFKNGLGKMQKDKKWGYIDEKGNVVIPFEYDDLYYNNWSEGVIGALKDHKWGFIDISNNVVIPFEYSQVNEFSEGLAFVSKDIDHCGYIDHHNNVVIPFIYHEVSYSDSWDHNFKNGRAIVFKDGKCGCINKKGEAIVPFKFYRIGAFHSGYSFVEIDNDSILWSANWRVTFFGYIDTTGKEYLMAGYDSLTYAWNVQPAPTEIPDHSDTLAQWKYRPYQTNSNAGVIYDRVYIKGDVDGKLTAAYYDSIRRADSLRKIEEERLYYEKHRWTLQKLLKNGLSAFVSEPRSYPDLDRLTEVSIAYGLMMGGGNYSENFIYPDYDRWTIFKEQTMYKIISDEGLRRITYAWVMPEYKEAFHRLHPFHQKTYKDIVEHLRTYINSYDEKKMLAYLKKDEPHFAQYDPGGKYNKYRKIYAFVDRLILLHKVISAKDAKVWVDKVADEVATW